MSPPLHRIAFVGTYPPRRCGIATFTRDLRSAVAARLPEASCSVVAMTDAGGSYAYPAEVAFECQDADAAAFGRAADFLNLANVDVVSLQHEYGIFGGADGGHVTTLLRDLRAPIHTTLHTVLARPTPGQRAVLDDVIRLSTRMAVMTERGRTLLREVHGVDDDRIDVIPHGIPDVPLVDADACKRDSGLAGRQVLLTFGLLAPSKGIETVIAALPEIVARHPRTVYVVLGATHPHLIRHDGERYRESLKRMAVDHGVRDHVVFHDRYVDAPELLAFIAAADIYVTPYLAEEQITSGTLAYAFGCGKPVVSTPYWHARELLADGRGVLVPFRDSAAIAAAVTGLLGDDRRRREMQEQSWARGREMVWPRVADRYSEALRRTRLAVALKPRAVGPPRPARPARRELPAPRLDHLWTLTDSTGLLQHATFDVPNASEGYCTDDNARALALAVTLEELGFDSPQVRRAAARYAAFVARAFVPGTGRFRNFLAYDRRWLDEAGSDDCLGRAVAALGICVGRSRRPALRHWAMGLLPRAVEALLETTSPRAWAHGILGIRAALLRLAGERRSAAVAAELTGRLLDLYRVARGPGWRWLEDSLAYENPRICQALIADGVRTGSAAAVEAGLEMLDWLADVQLSATGRFAPVGCHGFMPRGGSPAPFDQQPIEAHATVCGCIEAHRATGDAHWLDRAWNAFDWFGGHNVLGFAIHDPHTGGCRDGLLEDRTNENQGAESTLAYLAALLEMKALERVRPARPSAPGREALGGRPDPSIREPLGR